MTIKAEPYGRGIVTPFQRDNKGDFANASGTDVLNSDVGELLGIIGPTQDSPGELLWRCDLGSRLHTLRHRKLHSELVRATAEQMTAGVVREYEPRVRVGPSTVTVDDDNNTMQIAFSYKPIGTSDARTDTVRFTVEE